MDSNLRDYDEPMTNALYEYLNLLNHLIDISLKRAQKKYHVSTILPDWILWYNEKFLLDLYDIHQTIIDIQKDLSQFYMQFGIEIKVPWQIWLWDKNELIQEIKMIRQEYSRDEEDIDPFLSNWRRWEGLKDLKNFLNDLLELIGHFRGCKGRYLISKEQFNSENWGLKLREKNSDIHEDFLYLIERPLEELFSDVMNAINMGREFNDPEFYSTR